MSTHRALRPAPADPSWRAWRVWERLTASGHRRAPTATARIRRSEAGLSLVEVVTTVALLGLLGIIVVPIVSSFTAESSAVQGTYDAVNQLIEPSQIISQYVHEAVPAAPVGSSSAPWSVFTTNTGPEEIQFTADVGTYGQQSDAGSFTAYGPALVTVSVQAGSDGQPALVGTLVPADQGSCPGPPTSSGTACTWTGDAHRLFSVPDLTGACVPGSAGCVPADHPVFSYLIGSTMTSSPASTCSVASGTVSCPLDQIAAVQFTISARVAPGLPNGTQSEAYLLAPYYDPAVG